MSDEPPSNKAKAVTLAAQAADAVEAAHGLRAHLDKANVATIASALATDLDAQVQHADDHERLAKVEAQVRVLADAVIVIGAPSDAVDEAVKAVKDER